MKVLPSSGIFFLIEEKRRWFRLEREMGRVLKGTIIQHPTRCHRNRCRMAIKIGLLAILLTLKIEFHTPFEVYLFERLLFKMKLEHLNNPDHLFYLFIIKQTSLLKKTRGFQIAHDNSILNYF